MLRTATFVLILVLPLLASGCSLGSDDASAATIAVQTAARDTNADSARIELRLTGSDPEDGEFGGDFASGEVDFGAGVALLQTSGEDGIEPATLIYAGGKVYSSWMDTPYWMVADSEVGPALGLEPTRMFELIGRADDVELIATEDMEGLETRHYRFAFTTDDLSDALRDSQKGMTGTVDVWISDDRVHRVLSATEYGNDAHEGLRGLQLTTDTRLSDWGIEVDVTPPDPSLIKSFEELQSLD